jgi:hypothetical protein
VSERRPHPSGKPIRKGQYGVKSIWRIPDRGSVIPRLQQPATVNAIGFTARICAEDDDE